jgi:hypothetical protein
MGRIRLRRRLRLGRWGRTRWPNWTTIRKAPPQINELTSQGVFMRWPLGRSNQFGAERQLDKFRD